MTKFRKSKGQHVQLSEETVMVGRTPEGDPVWRHAGGQPFIIEHGEEMQFLWWRWNWCWWTFRRLPEPHLTYGQVATANEKSKIILRALRNGPIHLEKGFLKGRNGKILTTKAISRVVLHWLEGCGVVLTKEKLKSGRIRIDIDVEATNKNDVR